MKIKALIWGIAVWSIVAAPVSAQEKELRAGIQKLAQGFSGRVGVCLMPAKPPAAAVCSSGQDRFPLQSVMKLVVAATVFDAADRGKLSLTDVIEVRPEDGSPGPRAFIDLIRTGQIKRASIEELVRRAVTDSDSTAVDLLIRHLGGVSHIREFLERKGIQGVSIDRTERELQFESVGLTWEPIYADPDRFDQALGSLSREIRDRAWKRHLADQRDTATPEGMVLFLSRLSENQLLSSAATARLISIMEETATGVNRLKAGLGKEWRLAHKTGTGLRWNGISEATNDVGLIITPQGRKIPVAVFVSHSSAEMKSQEAVIEEVARLCSKHC